MMRNYQWDANNKVIGWVVVTFVVVLISVPVTTKGERSAYYASLFAFAEEDFSC